MCLGSYMFDTGRIFRVCPGIRFLVNGIRCTSEVGGFPFRVLDSEKEVFCLHCLFLCFLLVSFSFVLLFVLSLCSAVCVRLLLCVSRHTACIPCMHFVDSLCDALHLIVSCDCLFLTCITCVLVSVILMLCICLFLL